MAFHPFKHFRKRQKIYLAGLTILTMIIFVFSFGAADPFQSALRWIGLSVTHGEPVVELYGKTIRTEDLDKLQWRRDLASEFVISGSYGFWVDPRAPMNTPLAKSFLDMEIKFGQKKGQNDLPTPLQNTLMQFGSALFMARMSPPDMRLQPLQKNLAEIQKQMGYPETQNNPEQYRALDALATILAFQSWIYDPQKPSREYYFGGTKRTEDLLDFLIWKHEADRLGIVLTQADVCREVNRAWGNGDYLQPDGKFERNEWVANFFRNNSRIHKNLTERDLLAALTDEFRVALAKEAILGSASGVRSYREAVDHIHHSPSVATPDEFYKYFQERRTELSVKMLSIDVKDFVPQVKAEPTEADLRNLYARYQNDEPSPTRRQPGFKEPRRIKVEYVSYRPEGPFARQLAAKAMEHLPVLRVGHPAAPFAAGGGLAWAAQLAGYADVETAIRDLYDKYREDEKQVRKPVKYDADDSTAGDRFGLAMDFQDWRSTERQAAVATLGQLIGNAATGATPIAAPISWLAGETSDERATLTAFAATVLAGDSSSPLAAMTLPMRYLYVTQPLEGVRGQLLERFQTALGKKLMDDHITAMRKELDKVLAGNSEQKTSAFLKKAIPEYGLENFHAMTSLQTRQEILDHPDPALLELQTAYNASKSNSPMPLDFAAELFQPLDVSGRDAPSRSWQFTSPSGDVAWVFWRTEDQQARVRPFADIRGEVKDAWYLEQARRLARDKASEINGELKKQNLAPEAAVQFLTEQKLGRVFSLTRVSHLKANVFNLPTGPFVEPKYTPYQPPKEDVPYPPADFVAQLLKLKNRGESRVIQDQPVRHIYIAVLMENPQPPERSEFYKVYNLVNQENRNEFQKQEKPLWVQMMEDRQRKYIRGLMEQLRAEATKNLDNGEYVLPESVRNRGESSSDSGE
jgi:hypothetical protein